MKQVIKKTFLLGLGAATMTKNQMEKIVRDLVKNNAVTVKEGKDMLQKVKKKALSESSRVRKLAQTEAKRISKDLGIVSKEQMKIAKQRLTSLNKELSNEGKKTLSKIMKELSK